MVNKSWFENGRIETVLATLILGAVLVLFWNFYTPEENAMPAPEATTNATSVDQTTHPDADS